MVVERRAEAVAGEIPPSRGRASSRADAARNGGTPRGLCAGGVGFAWETL